jgi:hypothetical protein
MSDHECDSADCCEERNPVSTGNRRIRIIDKTVWPPLPGATQGDVPDDVVLGLKSRIESLEARLAERNEMMERWLWEGHGNEDRLAFLETRRVELQQMCERRSRELIEANERIAYLERCLGRLVAEREANGIRS